MLNGLILWVLHPRGGSGPWRGSVTNRLLRVLAVWDGLWLACELCEWLLVTAAASARPDLYTPTQITDAAYGWMLTLSLRELTAHWHRIDSTAHFVTFDFTVASAWRSYLNIGQYWLYALSVIFQMCSVYQTIAVATFRFVAVYWPFRAARWLTHRAAGATTACCLLLALAAHAPTLLYGVWLVHMISYAHQPARINAATKAHWYLPSYFESEAAFSSFFHMYHMVSYHVLLFFALPFLLLLALCVGLLYQLRKTRAQHSGENKAVTKVVVAVVMVFLVSYSVKPLYMVDVHWLDGALINQVAWFSCGAYFTASIAVILLPLVNSTLNFLLYVGLRRSFRKRFLAMVTRRDATPTK